MISRGKVAYVIGLSFDMHKPRVKLFSESLTMKSSLTDFGFHRRHGTIANTRALVGVCLTAIVFSVVTARADHPWFKGYINPDNGYRIFAFTDWDTPLFGGGIQPDLSCLGISPPAYRVDGHVMYEADGTGNCTVIQSTGSYSTDPLFLVGSVHPVSVQFAFWHGNPSGPPASDTRHDWDQNFLNILSGRVQTGCGDGICSPGEDSTTCPGDCPPVCGDGQCTAGETWESCPGDCPKPQPPVAFFKALRVSNLGRPDEQELEGGYMAGGVMRLDPSGSKDFAGRGLKYDWDFGGGEVIRDDRERPDVVFREAKVYTITLVVVDGAGTPSEPYSVPLDLSLQEGDLIFVRSAGYSTLFDLRCYFWTHVGMYIGDQMMVEAIFRPSPRSHETGVVLTPLSKWGYPYETCAVVLRVETDPSIRTQAVAFAREKLGWPYDWVSIPIGLCVQPPGWPNWPGLKQLDGPSYYCSELIWMAYYKASGGRINLGNKLPFLFVSPDDIANSSQVTELGRHKENVPFGIWPTFIYGRARCPVDLIVTDPNGLRLTKQECQIPDALYEESDIDGDGDLDDCFFIPSAKPGQYLIQVVPEPNALPDETFSLEVSVDGKSTVVAQDVPIRSIPQEPYALTVGYQPVAYWEFDEGSGTVANDLAGTNPGTVYGAKWVDGRIGGALRFNGVDDYVDCGNAQVLAPEKMTVTFWMFMEGKTSYQYILGKAKDMGLEQDYAFSTGGDGKLKFAFGEKTKAVSVLSKGQMALGQWVYVTATRDGATACLYLNGQLENSATYSFAVTNKGQSLRIGSIGLPEPEWAGFFKGMIDDVRIYDKALSAEEIQELYEQVSP
jgi:hypothetical protein